MFLELQARVRVSDKALGLGLCLSLPQELSHCVHFIRGFTQKALQCIMPFSLCTNVFASLSLTLLLDNSNLFLRPSSNFSGFTPVSGWIFCFPCCIQCKLCLRTSTPASLHFPIHRPTFPSLLRGCSRERPLVCVVRDWDM